MDSDPKSAVMRQIQQEAAVTNARSLIGKLNEHCFERCFPKPSTSTSKGEETCMSQCIEKYMAAWNAVSKVQINRMQRDQTAAQQALF